MKVSEEEERRPVGLTYPLARLEENFERRSGRAREAWRRERSEWRGVVDAGAGRSPGRVSRLGARRERPSKPLKGAEEHLGAVSGGAQPGANGGEVAPERAEAAQ